MKRTFLFSLILSAGVQVARGDDSFPLVPDDIEVALFAQEPLVRNPCAITFDAQGRLCVGMGPQYRNPGPDTPGDSVYLLIDEDGDGKADRRKEFATGLNCIQGLAWKGNELWIANSPDLTVVRDLDGDDEADEYIRLFTDLGNLEHALHGLNWAPDGKLYMSKGNSKGYTEPPDRLAPRAFRQLWGVDSPDLLAFPPPLAFKKGAYQKAYHDPEDDWGREGGILRCDSSGENLEIVARGFRNPWDIAFDDGFTWLGTDNDQTMGDKIFSPFYGAHFGWGHPWSFDWKGENHLPTVPAAAPLFEGSGAGVIYCGLARYPEKYRHVFFLNDWLRREVYIFRPTWHGASLAPQKHPFDLLASAGGGRSMERSFGRKFDPVDIELGPDQAIYISSWGREYGAQIQAGQMVNEGRIYRLWPRATPPVGRHLRKQPTAITQRSVSELIEDLGSHLPVWRANAQAELVRRGARAPLEQLLEQKLISKALETWAAWTLGLIDPADAHLDLLFSRYAVSEAASLNLRLQSIRILAHRRKLAESIAPLLHDSEPRIRLETVLALHQVGNSNFSAQLVDLAAAENDRLVFYAAWRALRDLLPESDRRALARDPRAGVRRAATLGLLEDNLLSTASLQALGNDPDPPIAALARRRLAGKAETIVRGRPLPAEPARAPSRVDGPGTVAAFQDILNSMATADSARGRDLFLRPERGGCVVCHRLEGIGNLFGPDLKEIGARADAAFIIHSIIDPGSVITEGFATQIFTLKDGESYSGILLEETGAAVKIALATGETVTLPRSAIASRKTSRESAMPANYAELLTPQQIADMTLYLQGPSARATEPSPRSPEPFTVRRQDGQFAILLGSVPIASYLYRHTQLTRPAFINVRTAAGIPVTREFPAPPAADHPSMHPGIAVSFGFLDGNDYWRGKAKVEHVTFTQEPHADPAGISWGVRNRYLSEEGQQTVCFEETRYAVDSTEDGVVLRIASEFFNPERDFYFGDQEESGLAIRMPPALSVKGGTGSILNDRGETDEAGTWGHDFRWIDYSGISGNKRVGLLIVPDQTNPRRCWSHSRDYGVLVANPFPRQPQERREPYVKTWVRKGERYRMGFAVLIYETGLSP